MGSSHLKSGPVTDVIHVLPITVMCARDLPLVRVQFSYFAFLFFIEIQKRGCDEWLPGWTLSIVFILYPP